MTRLPSPKYDREAICGWIADYKQRHGGNSPTVREIASAFNIPSISQVRYILTQLQREGKIRFTDGRARSIEVPGWTFRPD